LLNDFFSSENAEKARIKEIKENVNIDEVSELYKRLINLEKELQKELPLQKTLRELKSFLVNHKDEIEEKVEDIIDSL